MFSPILNRQFKKRENKVCEKFHVRLGHGLFRKLVSYTVFGDTFGKDEDFGKSAPFYFCLNMKKFFTLIFACFISFNAIQAEITLNLSDDGTLTISGTDMPDYSYSSSPWSPIKKAIKKIVIENGVTNIGKYAFYECSNLTSVTIPESVTSIGDNAFYGCKGLTSVTIPNTVTSIGEKAFSGCSGLESVTIPNNIRIIEEEIFANCSSLKSITIGNSVASIEDKAFYECSVLKSITIPNSVTSIGNYAFYGCI